MNKRGAVGREGGSRGSRQQGDKEEESAAAAGNQQQQQHGRPVRSTVVHQRAQVVAVDRPVDRLTLPSSRLGTVDRHGRPVLGLVDRPVDRQTGSGCFGKFVELKISPNRKLIPRVSLGI